MAIDAAKLIREGMGQKVIDSIVEQMTRTPEWEAAYQAVFASFQDEARKLVDRFMPEEGVFNDEDEDQELWFEVSQAVVHRLRDYV